MTRLCLAVAGVAAGVAVIALPVPTGDRTLLLLTVPAALLALAAGRAAAHAAARHGDRGEQAAIAAGLLMLGAAVPCPLPPAAAAGAVALTVCAFATGLAAAGLLPPASRGHARADSGVATDAGVRGRGPVAPAVPPAHVPDDRAARGRAVEDPAACAAPPAAVRRSVPGDAVVLLLALAAGCVVALAWAAEARGAAGALACAGALLHLARSTATPSRPTP